MLFLIGVRMIFPPPKGGIFGGDVEREPFIVPMAIPGVAGPSAMAALMLLADSQTPDAPSTGVLALSLRLARHRGDPDSATYLYPLSRQTAC